MRRLALITLNRVVPDLPVPLTDVDGLTQGSFAMRGGSVSLIDALETAVELQL